MSSSADYSEELQLVRSLLIVTTLQKRRDLKALELIRGFPEELEWDLEMLGIDTGVWEYVKTQTYDPKLVFCHPRVLLYAPGTSLYYRGLTGLSIKAAKTYVGATESLEEGAGRGSLSERKALLMARTYNRFICAIIKGAEGWTLDNGHRTVVANLGITIDGSMRNRIGRIAEEKVRNLVLEWLYEEDLIAQPENAEELLSSGVIPGRSMLKNGVEMIFGSEPDVSFFKEGVLLATVEIKGGIDPAGALERYGAATKSFQEAIKVSARCVNFYLGAVFTLELEKRMESDRLVHRHFDIVQLLGDPDYRETFLNELFHHTLRII